MAKHAVEDIRNVAFVGHGASGKTTLADLLLFKTGAVGRAGSVADGTSHLDVDDEEKESKHSVSSSLIHVSHGGKHVNVVDTPGYPDFIGQVPGALRAVETAAVVVSAAAGIEANARRTMALAKEAGLARMVVVNKCDGDNIDLPGLLESLREHFGGGCLPLNVPNGTGAGFTGVTSALEPPAAPPAGLPVDLAAANQQLLDAIVEADESLMERFLEGQALTPEEISAGVSKAMTAGTLVPIVFTCAKSGTGVPELLDVLARFAPSPAGRTWTGTDAQGGPVELHAAADGPFAAQVWKTRIDPFVAKMSFLRIVSGHLAKDATIHKAGGGRPAKVAQVFAVQGGHTEPLDDAVAGDLVVVVKMDELHVGDTVTRDGAVSFPAIRFPTPMIGLAVEPKTQADQQKISGALHKIEEEDPTFRVSRDPQTKEMVMNGMSELHLNVVKGRLHKRDKVDVLTHQPKIPYREACAGEAEGHYRHKKQSGGSGQFAEVHFRIKPLPHGIVPEEYFTRERFESMREFRYDPVLNYCFVDSVTGGTVPNNFIPAVEKGIKDRMEKGVLAGYQVQDTVCELFFGKDHPVDSNESAFKTAANRCFRDVFAQARPVLLEPIVTAEISVPGEKLGDITSDLNGRRGRVEGMDGAPGGFQVIKAKVPLAEVMTYARALSSMTGGQGSFTIEFSHYEMVPGNEQQKIVAAAKKHEEEEE
jgi:elongation factor G